MSEIKVPHFDLPFRLAPDGQFAVVEQDSDADVLACMRAVLLGRKRQRLDRPEFGIDDPTFHQGGADLDAIRADLDEQEPRARALLDRDPSLLAQLVDEVFIDPQGGAAA